MTAEATELAVVDAFGFCESRIQFQLYEDVDLRGNMNTASAFAA
jgi:hypothetical protein